MTKMFPPIVGMMTMMMSRAAHFSWISGASAARELLVLSCATTGWDMLLLKFQRAWARFGALIVVVMDRRSAWSQGPTGKGAECSGMAQGLSTRCIFLCTVHRPKWIAHNWLKIHRLKGSKIKPSNAKIIPARVVLPQHVAYFPCSWSFYPFIRKRSVKGTMITSYLFVLLTSRN